jgi:hypothetical protein
MSIKKEMLLTPSDFAFQLAFRAPRRKQELWIAACTPHTLTSPALTPGDCLDAYDHEKYTSMNQDKVRNTCFRRAIARAAIHANADSTWLDIGTGGSALLSLMILRQISGSDALVVGIEGNLTSARSARTAIRQSGHNINSFLLLEGLAEDVVPQLKQALIIHVVVAEILGTFASSEGYPLLLKTLCLTPTRTIPRYAATFVGPICLDKIRFRRGRGRYWHPRTLLAAHINLNQMSMAADGWRAAEFFDFEGESIADLPLLQEHVHEFLVAESGFVDGIGCFLWCGCAEGEEERVDGSLRKSLRIRAVDGTCFPYGDQRLSHIKPALTFSSFVGDGPSTASNWRNAIIFFDQRVPVVKGECLRLVTRFDVRSDQPTYIFDLPDKQNVMAQVIGLEELVYPTAKHQ